MAKEISAKIRIIKACYVGKTARKEGEILTVSDKLARELAWMKKAELVKPEPVKPEPAQTPPWNIPDAVDATVDKGDEKTSKGGKVK